MNKLQSDKPTLTILLAEDDTNLGGFLKSYLENKGFAVGLFTNGEDALKAFLDGGYNFCITDVMMPVKDGFSLAKDIRKKDANIPILFLTAKTLEADRLKGFQVGGDDYLTKPFSMDELLLRIQAISRRMAIQPTAQKEQIFDLGNIRFDYTKQMLFNDTQQIGLTSKESELLLALCLREGQVVERGEALVKIWHSDNYFNARSMDVYIAKLRRLLKEHSTSEILNVHGVGFKLLIHREPNA